jgi:hypothetical protein
MIIVYADGGTVFINNQQNLMLGTADSCIITDTRPAAITVSNEYYKPISNNNWRSSWLTELDRRQRLGIKAAQRRHSRPPAIKCHGKAKAYKYYREPRRQMADISNCVPATML